MVNHIRTWLGNLQPASGKLKGEEFIDPNFVPVPLANMPVDLLTVRNMLFGTDLNRDAVNVKLTVYLMAIHVAGFDEEVLAKDRRITYEVDGSDIFGSDIVTAARQHILANVIKNFANVPVGFFDGYDTYKNIWNDPNKPVFSRLAVLLLTTALRTAAASQSEQT